MPTEKLALDADPRSTAWRALIGEVQADEDVRSLSILWQLPDDNEADDPAPREVITVRVVPTFATMTPVACLGWGKRLWDAPVVVGLEITVPGEASDNAANVWRAIEMAATGAKHQHVERVAFNQRLADAGLMDVDTIEPAFSSEDSKTAVGSLQLVVQVER